MSSAVTILNNRFNVIPCSFLNSRLIVVSEHSDALANADLFPSNFSRKSL